MSALPRITSTRSPGRVRSLAGQVAVTGGIGELHDRAIVAHFEHRRVEPLADAIGQHGGLDPGHRGRLELARPLRRHAHERGERWRATPAPTPGTSWSAHSASQTTRPQRSTSRRKRRGDVRVRRRDRRLHGIARHPAVEGLVARAAEEPACRAHHREGGRVGAVESAQVLAVRDRLGPRPPERHGLRAERGDARGVGCGHGAEDADAGLDHELRGGHAGHERQLARSSPRPASRLRHSSA